MQNLLNLSILFTTLLLLISCEESQVPTDTLHNADSSTIKDIDTVFIHDTLKILDTIKEVDTVIVVDTVTLIDSLTGEAVKDDKYESDDNHLKACSIKINETQNHILRTENSDWLIAKLDSGQLYDILITSDEGKELPYLDISLYTPTAHASIKSETITSYKNNLRYQSTQTDYYPFRISTHNPESSFVYSVQIRPIQEITPDMYEPNDSPDMATSLTLNNLSLDHSLIMNDVDWFYTVLDSGKSYQVTTFWDDIYKGYYGQCLYNSTVDTCLEGFQAYGRDSVVMKFSCKKTDEYYLSISDVNELQGRYSILITEINTGTADSFEPDNSLENANTISIGIETLPHTLTVNDTDFFSMEVISGQYYRFTTFSDSYYLSLRSTNKSSIQGHSTTKHADNSKIEETSYWQADSTGNFYFYVEDYKGTITPYTLIVDTVTMGTNDSFEPNDNYENATSLKVGDSLTHSLTLVDRDYFSLPDSLDGTFTVEVTNTNMETLSLVLFNHEKAFLVSESNTESSISKTWNTKDSNVKYIHVSANEEYGTYTITLSKNL